MAKILPSLFAANLLQLGEEIKQLDEQGCEIWHLDMMDGNFVPHIAFGPAQLRALKKASDRPFDVHMMVADVEKHLDAVLDTGAEMISFHIESGPHPNKFLQKIRQAGRKAGLVLCPGTGLATLDYLLDYVDYVLLMSVNPGTEGQTFLPETLEKVKKLKEKIGSRPIRIEVDGGLNLENIQAVKDAGADLLVVGGALFKSDTGKAFRAFHSLVNAN
ncbi:MAG: ribulose-phosphate 3-epimerase [Peptoniphilaceae bacterium]|nr:ribulose-phosphate 3-epimerase [Peptoniphilaceae bacterium]MDD7434485.1 ribulose-phosphate 3-epimerase [Peptoniphilaceae bacterium]MDY3076472.1 ribulose-phosphate 3-epimerase [Peptoniphilaceae bacterium]